MNDSSCPYCNSAQSLLVGNVYCSHQGKEMTELRTGTLYIRSKKLEETKEHVSRLSIRCVMKGEQYYNVGGHEHKVTLDNYLVVNQGQNYRTSFEGDEEQEMLLVAFEPRVAEQLLYSLLSPEDKLLDDPFNCIDQSVCFFEKTYDKDPVISSLFHWLRQLMDEDMAWRNTVDLDSVYATMLSRLMYVHRNLNTEISRISSTKYSTRVELYKRLSVARDFMDANLNRKLSSDEIAGAAYMSPYHFKRAFKRLFGITPHRYHVKKRMEYSFHLLGRKEKSVTEICQYVGFENTSSFIRLFRQHYGTTPGNFIS